MFYYENTKTDRRLERTTKEVKASTKLFLVCWLVASLTGVKQYQQQHTVVNKPAFKQSVNINDINIKRLAALKNFIKRKEGYKTAVYKDIAGFKTVGYGHKVTGKENIRNHEVLLHNDALKAHNTIASVVKIPLTKGQYIALASLTYNIGENAFKNSTLLQCVNVKDYKCANNEFYKWVYAGGKKAKGLENRRHVEATMFSTL